jgi:hypothetical protein
MTQRSDRPEEDPTGLDSVERAIRIKKLQQQLHDLAGGEVMFGNSDQCDPKMQEAFLQRVLEFELGEREGRQRKKMGFRPVTPFDELKKEGVDLPQPHTLSDEALTPILWKLIEALGVRGCYLQHTDHLSDRQLYDWLWNHELRQELQAHELPFGNCYIDLLGGCSEEDMQLELRYYADEYQREDWALEYPDIPMPPREKPPYDRDRLLPRSNDS